MPGMGVPSTVTQGKKAKMILAGVRKEFLTIGSATQNAAGPEARPRSWNFQGSQDPPTSASRYFLPSGGFCCLSHWGARGPSHRGREGLVVNCIMGKGKLGAFLQGAPTIGTLGADRPETLPLLPQS